jgi:hypothetical protein
MGEYAKYSGREVKIGTCEDMYYLRYDQRHLVERVSGSVDVISLAHVLRFRFPWPDEDHVSPCGDEFHDNGFSRTIAVPGNDIVLPDFDHFSVQFTARAGYLIGLPCPEAGAAYWEGLGTVRGSIHRNGFSGKVHLCAQKPAPMEVNQDVADREVWIIVQCGGCGAMCRLEKWAGEAQAVALAFMEEAARRDNGRPDFYIKIAARIAAGYRDGRVWLDSLKAPATEESDAENDDDGFVYREGAFWRWSLGDAVDGGNYLTRDEAAAGLVAARKAVS